jgi:mutator protein MutT
MLWPVRTASSIIGGMEHDPVTVTAAIIIDSGRVLVAQRPPSGRHPGAWEFPGGKVEPGETPAQCLAREMLEEMDVTVRVGRMLAEVRHSYADMTIDLLAFACAITMGTLSDIGCSSHQWVLPVSLRQLDLLPPDRQLAAEIFGL